MKKIIIASSKNWFFLNKRAIKLIKKRNIIIIKSKKKLNLNNLKKIKPSKIYFPHWSYRVPKKIIENYECICFHTAPLPYGRGGSPIQNLILRGKRVSSVCALKMTDVIDSGPIYIKKKIILSGTLSQILDRVAHKIVSIINQMNKQIIKPKPQRGKILIFKRIKEINSQISGKLSLERIYDKIRMVDSPEYPLAFIKKKNIKIEFTNPILKRNYISCNAKIIKKKN